MSGFNWDEHPLVSKESPSFNWDEHPISESQDDSSMFGPAISELANQPHEQYLNAKNQDIGKGLIQTLPTIGGLAGIAGGAGIASVPIGAAGAAGGKALEQYLLNKYYGENKDIGNEALATGAEGLILGGVMHGVGVASPYIGKGLSKLGSSISDYASSFGQMPKPNIEEIKAAASRLGIEPTAAMLSNNPSINKAESTLAQSPRFTATEQRVRSDNNRMAIGNLNEEYASKNTRRSPFEIGDEARSALISDVKAAKEPTSELYNSVNSDLYNIPLKEENIDNILDTLKDDKFFIGQKGNDFLNDYKNEIKSLETVGDLKEYRTKVRSDINNLGSSTDKVRLGKIINKITELRDGSIESMKQDPFVSFSKSGISSVDDLQSRLALADASHRTNLEDINSISSILGGSKEYSQGEFINKLGNFPKEKLIKNSASTDIQSIMNLKDKNPVFFEKVKEFKRNEMLDQASKAQGGMNTKNFVKQFDKLQPEVKTMMFSPEEISKIDDLRLVMKETPEPIGKSGTPEGQSWKQMLNPKPYLEDYAASRLIKGDASTKWAIKSIGNNIESVGSFMNKIASPKALGSSPYPMINSINKEEPEKTNPDQTSIMDKVKGSKYEQILQNSLARGKQSFAAANYVLKSRDQNYRDILNQENNNQA